MVQAIDRLSRIVFFFVLYGLLAVSGLQAQSGSYRLQSPDNTISLQVSTRDSVTWSVWSGKDQVLLPSVVSLQLDNGETLGNRVSGTKSARTTVNRSFVTPFYKKASVTDLYNELRLTFSGSYGLIFRAYNDGVAYRFFTNRRQPLTILGETASFRFTSDVDGLFAINTARPVEEDAHSSYFETLYRQIPVSKFPKDTLAFLPALLSVGQGKKMAILEADLEDYPGMFLQPSENYSQALQGNFARYPAGESLLQKNKLDTRVDGRERFIARVDGKHEFPWRVLLLSNSDKELLNNDMVQKLAAPSRITDLSWIRPGKVAWDWWNDWNVSHVDFKAGINTETYKYYIDFAAENKLEYIIMDEGWSNDTNLLDVSPAISLDSVISYGNSRNVGVILWSTIYAANKNTPALFAHYGGMGVKGFKIDFIDRDDQQMVNRIYKMAGLAAENKLVLDLHGMFKPSGLLRTYPNVLNCEGVRGLENFKGSNESSVPIYDAQIPFIRMLAGPMDYTPGAMRNANKNNFRAVNSMPMSLGTRCHQLAMYTLYEAPLQMLSDNPTAYRQDMSCTRFIASFPTVFDETVALDGTVGEFAVVARRKGNAWYIGALNNWTPRDLDIPLDFLGGGSFEAETFADGLNAERDGTDYVRTVTTLQAHTPLHIHLAAGGGWAAILHKK